MPYIYKIPSLELAMPRDFTISNYFMMGTVSSAAAVSNTSYFSPHSQAPKKFLAGEILSGWVYCSTAAATITWAEMGLWTSGAFNGASPTLTRVAWTNVATKCNTTGMKKIDFTFTSTVLAGTLLWFSWGSQATTPYLLKGLNNDDLEFGTFWSKATTRISTAASPLSSFSNSITLLSPYLFLDY